MLPDRLASCRRNRGMGSVRYDSRYTTLRPAELTTVAIQSTIHEYVGGGLSGGTVDFLEQH